MGSADLELILEAWGLDPGSPPQGPRHVADVLRDMLAALSAATVEYVLAGTMAYGLYARARYPQRSRSSCRPGRLGLSSGSMPVLGSGWFAATLDVLSAEFNAN